MHKEFGVAFAATSQRSIAPAFEPIKGVRKYLRKCPLGPSGFSILGQPRTKPETTLYTFVNADNFRETGYPHHEEML